MSLYTYKGLAQEEKAALVKAHMVGVVPPEKRGQPAKYRIDKEDDEDVREEKRKLKAKWLKEREAEILAEVEKLDASAIIGDAAKNNKPALFKKGEPVEVAAGTELAKKLDMLCGVGKPDTKVRRAWEKTEKTEKKG